MIIKEIYREFPLDLLLIADPSETLIEQYLENGCCYIAIEHEETIGVYVLLETSPDKVELVNIAVTDSYQGEGIGKTLVLDAIERAKSEGYKVIEVGTGNSSLHQLGLYQKCGFRITGVERDYFLDHYDEEILENGIHCVDRIRLSLLLK